MSRRYYFVEPEYAAETHVEWLSAAADRVRAACWSEEVATAMAGLTELGPARPWPTAPPGRNRVMEALSFGMTGRLYGTFDA